MSQAEWTAYTNAWRLVLREWRTEWPKTKIEQQAVRPDLGGIDAMPGGVSFLHRMIGAVKGFKQGMDKFT